MGTSHNDNTDFLIIPRSILLRIRKVLNKSCREKNAHFKFSNFFFENRVVYEIMWNNVVAAGQAIDGNMAHAHCMLDN